MVTTIAINGACGRMGLTVGRLAAADGRFKIAAALEVSGHAEVGKPYAPAPEVKVSDRLEGEIDAVVDFSLPPGALQRLSECEKACLPLVICTTGFKPDEEGRIAQAAKKIPVVLSSNMSVGINLLFRILPQMAEALGAEYDIDVVEIHHKHKKDAPSGTAKSLMKHIGREAKAHALRSGDEVGEHRVVFGGLGERIEVVHRATTREVFARGALRAAEFAAKAKPGMYSMLDVIGCR